jgi:hypothetical protein
MLGFLRLIVFGFLFLSVIYVALSIYSRAVRRRKLNAKWLAGPRKLDRDTFVRRGLTRYDRSVRRKLILGVYIIPMVLVGLIIYLTNFS